MFHQIKLCFLGQEKDLADKIYNTLTTKYDWRDWMAVVFTAIKGSDKKYVDVWKHNRESFMKLNWHGKYNVLVSSINKDFKIRKIDLKTVQTYREEKIVKIANELLKNKTVHRI